MSNPPDVPRVRAPSAMSDPNRRTTDTALQMPTSRQALRMLRRVVRLRCPHCGNGAVMSGSGSILKRCSSCNFRYERSDENYFSGAMFFGLLFGEFLFAISLLIVIVSMWPNVPWKIMTWAMPVGMVVVMLFWIPVSRVVWLAIDVMVRPVHASELEGQALDSRV